MIFQSMASFIDRSIGFEPNNDLTRMNAQYIDISSKVLMDHREVR